MSKSKTAVLLQSLHQSLEEERTRQGRARLVKRLVLAVAVVAAVVTPAVLFA